MELLIADLVAKYPMLMSVIIAIGVLRVIFKPLMLVIKSGVEATPSPKDDEFFAKMQESFIYKAFAWVVDFAASIKLPGQK